MAPFYIEQETPVPPGGLPQPGKVVVNLPDNHLQYAVTWYGLAVALVGVLGPGCSVTGGEKPRFRATPRAQKGRLRIPCEGLRFSITVALIQGRGAFAALANMLGNQ